MLFGEHLLERMVLGVDLRAGRAVGTRRQPRVRALWSESKEALVTAVGLNGFEPSTDWLLGAATVVLVGVGAWCLAASPGAHPARCRDVRRRRRPLRRPLLGRASASCPGCFTACPLAAVGVVLAWSRRACRVPALLAVVALPIVWIAQYSGNAKPQWGGRYELLSGVLLAVVAVVALRDRRAALVATVALSVAVTACGVAWLSVRSHAVADGMETLVARHDQAVVSMEGHLLREGGAFYDPDRHWLTATTGQELRKAVGIVRAAGDTEVAVIAPAAERVPARLGGFVRNGERGLEIRPGERLRVLTYRDSASP